MGKLSLTWRHVDVTRKWSESRRVSAGSLRVATKIFAQLPLATKGEQGRRLHLETPRYLVTFS